MSINSFRLLSLAFYVSMQLAVLSVKGQSLSTRNDHIFPPSKSAANFINYDKKGFLINGKRTFIVSAGIEYARVPRDLWEDRLLRLKRGGFNAVEVYTFWNFHEEQEGKFNFSDDRDLDHFLQLVKKLGMYAIVRVGPYYCGEWNFGGYPIWLKFKPGLVARKDNKPFLDATDKFFDKLIPIVTKNQIHNGGSVILVQLENEHPEAWGTVVPNNYFRHLINKTTDLGLEVPYFFSGLHPGNDPAGNQTNLDDEKRPNPWFSTEFWGVWFFNYGPQPQDSTIYDRRTWKIIAHGGNGYNVYMAHGGSNFDYSNDRDMAASYDYGAGVGQAGDLRPIYFGFKRAAWFARSFQDILTNSSDGGNSGRWMVRDTVIKINSRVGPVGSITFLDNPGKAARRAYIQPPKGLAGATPLLTKIAGGEIVPVVQNFQLSPAIKLVWAPSRIYSIIQQGKTTTMIVHGDINSSIQLYFSSATLMKAVKGIPNFILSAGKARLSTVVKPVATEYLLQSGLDKVKILVMPSSLASRTWIIDQADQSDKQLLISGPSYVGAVGLNGKAYSASVERPWNEKKRLPSMLYTEDSSFIMKANSTVVPARQLNLKLEQWQVKTVVEPAQIDFDDHSWMSSDQPLQMGADGDVTANAWYRTKVKVDTSGTYVIRFKNLRERAMLFLNGEKIDSPLVDKSFTLPLEAGKQNTISIFTSHNGRNKQLFYLGGLDTIDVKGITSPVTIYLIDSNATQHLVNGWKMKGGPGDPYDNREWKNNGQDNYHGPSFYRSSFTVPEVRSDQTTIWRVNITSMGHGSVWVNGHNLGRYPEKIKIFGLYIPETWLKPGKNSIVIFDENGTNPGKVSIQAETQASRDIFLLTGS